MNDTRRIRILIVDDHPIVRKGLRDMIEREDPFQVVAEAGDGESACDCIRRDRPDIVLLDLEMPGMSGLEVAQKAHDEELSVSILILTMYKEEAIFNRAMDLGVMGYILKDSAPEDVVRGIRAVSRGELFISPALTTRALKNTTAFDRNADSRLGLHLLSPMERKVLRFMAASKSSRQIAEELHLSIRTVEHHRYNISQKLRRPGSYSLLRFALENREYL